MKISSCVTSVFFAVTLILVPAALFAMVVTEVAQDGSLTLEDGKQVSLAGIQMDAQGVSVLRVLADKQDVRVEVLETVRDPQGRECVYAYLKGKSLKMPFKTGEEASESEIFLNEFLLRTGAAKVDEEQMISKKNRFLAAQDEAKKKGEGVWSYVAS